MVDRLQEAVATRDSIEQAIREKLGEIQAEFKSVAAVLDSGYGYRVDKANKSLVSKSLLVTPDSEQKTGQEQSSQVKKAKISASSS